MASRGWFGRRVGGAFLFRRLLVELRKLRVAGERQADALELLAGTSPRQAAGGQTFRAYAGRQQHLSDQEVQELTGVSYTGDAAFNAALALEARLREILKRDPTEQELERAYQMELGIRV